MSTAGQPDALARRIEALAAAVDDEGDTDSPSFVALVEALRAEVGALRAELGQVRDEQGASVATAALADVRDAVEPRLVVLADDLETLSERVEALGRDGATTTAEALVAVREALEPRLAALQDMLEPRLAVLEEALGGLAERIEALARDGASTTTALLEQLRVGVQGIDRRLDEGSATSADARDDALRSELLAALAAAEQRAASDRERAARELAAVLEQVARDRAEAQEQAARDRAAADELAASVRSAVDRLTALAAAGPVPSVPAQPGPVPDDVAAPVEQEQPAGADRLGQEVREAVAASVGEVQSGLEQLRSDLRAAVQALSGELAASAGGQERALEQLRGEVGVTVGELRDRLVRASADQSGTLAGALSAALAETREDVTTSTAALREELLTHLQAQHEAVVEALRSTAAEVSGSTGEIGQRLGVLTAVSDEVGHSVAAITAGISAATEEMAAELRARTDDESVQAAQRLTALDDQVRAQLALARESWDERAAELLGTLARGLAEIAEEVDIAATTTRDSSQRVTVLTELAEVQRNEVASLLRSVTDDVVAATSELRAELLARTSEQLGQLETALDQLGATVGAGSDDLGGRLDAVGQRVVQGRDAAEQAAARLGELVATTGRLDGTVAGFRDEWPTRTYELVEGARAVAEAVVLDVRAEVSARLDEVRATLEDTLGALGGARDDLDDGTDRLAHAGAVLVAYLEHRDRLLEAERDRVLHDVLDEFAAGLSSRERSALAARVSDAVTRRKDARDAERYREALGEPVPPTAELPDDVLALAARGGPAGPAGEASAPERPPGPGRAGPAVPGPAAPGPAAPGPVAARDDRPESAHGEPFAPEPAPSSPAPSSPAPSSPAPSSPAPSSAASSSTSGGRSVVPGPGRRSTPAAGVRPGRAPAADRAEPSRSPRSGSPRSGSPAPTVPGTTVRPAPSRQRAAAPPPPTAAPAAGGGARSVPGPGRARGRLGAMPEPPSVDVALEAAAPRDDDRS